MRRVSTADLLQQCGWLSVRQLCQYVSVVELHKVLCYKEPKYLYDKPTKSRQDLHYSTRQHYICENGTVECNGKLMISSANLEMTKSSWRWRAATVFNSLPLHYRLEKEHSVFKQNVKEWIKHDV